MKIVAILLIALVSVNAVSLTQKFPFNYGKNRSIMNVMLQVENKLKSKSPLDAILNVLQDFRDTVNTEQVNHDQIHNTQKSECESENTFRAAQVQDASNVLRDSTAQLNSCTNQKLRASNSLDVNEHQTFTNTEHLKIVHGLRDLEEQHYNQRSQNHQDALDSIEEAQDILGSIFHGGASFVELHKVAKKMLGHAVNHNTHNFYAPVLAAFAQLAVNEQQVDESALERVGQLLETLRKNLQNGWEAYGDDNAKAVASFNEQVETLKKNLQRLEKQADRLEYEIDNLNQCIGTQSAVAQTASNKLQRNQQLWDQATALCSTFDNEYGYATTSRRQELQLVSELETLVERRFAQVADESAEIKANIRGD